jgi:hypothetical protein
MILILKVDDVDDEDDDASSKSLKKVQVFLTLVLSQSIILGL